MIITLVAFVNCYHLIFAVLEYIFPTNIVKLNFMAESSPINLGIQITEAMQLLQRCQCSSYCFIPTSSVKEIPLIIPGNIDKWWVLSTCLRNSSYHSYLSDTFLQFDTMEVLPSPLHLMQNIIRFCFKKASQVIRNPGSSVGTLILINSTLCSFLFCPAGLTEQHTLLHMSLQFQRVPVSQILQFLWHVGYFFPTKQSLQFPAQAVLKPDFGFQPGANERCQRHIWRETGIILKGTCFRLDRLMCSPRQAKTLAPGKWLEAISAHLESSEEFRSSKLFQLVYLNISISRFWNPFFSQNLHYIIRSGA